MHRIIPLLILITMHPGLDSIAQDIQAREGVVLLHGLGRSSDSMKKMESALRKAGFVVYNVNYPSRTASIETLADKVITSALQNDQFDDCSTVHFVTHSLGGILVRSYVARHDTARIGRVVMLGPPNQGSEVVDRIGAWPVFKSIGGLAGQELGTGDNSTPNHLGPVAFELGIIAGDRSINWINSLMIDGKDDGKVSVERTKVEGMTGHMVIHATHPYLMKNKQAIMNTIHFLKTGTFTPLPPVDKKKGGMVKDGV
ncbi:MAG TPA: alpha/beta fold hydrolase [Kiritimatiellia bacterium]|nr:alpha/beta fold hydrolase [Kiritimatiellia bacterium]